MKFEIIISPAPTDLANRFADFLLWLIKEASSRSRIFTIALSGGNTPKLLFPVIASRLSDSVPLHHVHIFWVDERCVAPEDKESNFGMTKSTLLDKIKIPSTNIHRIMGENDPVKEAESYSKKIESLTRERKGFPVFDLIILGLGEDGHTASIFPGNNRSFDSEHICETSVHPVSHQKRISITGRVINNADNICFLVTGENKASVAAAIIDNTETRNYPARLVSPEAGSIKWYLDADAARLVGRR